MSVITTSGGKALSKWPLMTEALRNRLVTWAHCGLKSSWDVRRVPNSILNLKKNIILSDIFTVNNVFGFLYHLIVFLLAFVSGPARVYFGYHGKET